MGVYTEVDIYKSPIERPGFNYKTWQEDEKNYREEVRAFCIKHSKGKNVGETIRIQHADSYAEYMVFSMSPLKLIHLEVGDAWDSPYAELLTPKKVEEMIEREIKLKSITKKF